MSLTGATPEEHSRRRTIVLNEGSGMQQDGIISWEPVAQIYTLKPWQIVIAVFLFACVIYAVVWWTRRRPENNPGFLCFREDHPHLRETSD
jgi:hypothetical protein